MGSVEGGGVGERRRTLTGGGEERTGGRKRSRRVLGQGLVGPGRDFFATVEAAGKVIIEEVSLGRCWKD